VLRLLYEFRTANKAKKPMPGTRPGDSRGVSGVRSLLAATAFLKRSARISPDTMKALLYLLLLFFQTPIWAEGILTFTKVTPENREKLDYHSLRVERNSQFGKSYIALYIVTQKANPLLSCKVTIYASDKKKVLVQFDAKISTHPKNPTYFYVADELVERVQVQYFLNANEFQSHMFTIEAGKLNWIVTP
jgi:hypothetical protein